MLYLSLLGEPKAFPITRARHESIRRVRVRASNLMETFGRSKAWSPEVALPFARPLFGQAVPSFSIMAYGFGHNCLFGRHLKLPSVLAAGLACPVS